jgi:hypothetical protein
VARRRRGGNSLAHRHQACDRGAAQHPIDEQKPNMHPLLIHEWTPDASLVRRAPAVGRPCRPARADVRAQRRLRGGGAGSWRQAVGMWLVEAGLALAVRD